MVSHLTSFRFAWAALLASAALPAIGTAAELPTDNALRFGALDSVHDVSLSPDGSRLAFITNSQNRGRRLYVVGTEDGAQPKEILSSDGTSGIFLSWCGWVSDARLVCQTFSRDSVAGELLAASNMIAVDAAGGKMRMLSNRPTARSLYADFRGGTVIDWSSNDGSVLMTRTYVPETDMGTRTASKAEGMGVDRVDTQSGAARRVETPNKDAIGYLSDGHGNVRVMATQAFGAGGQLESVIHYFFRPKSGGNWKSLSQLGVVSEKGFYPLAVDADSDRVIGFDSIDGRKAMVAIAMDGTGAETTLYKHPEVDIDEVIRVGRNGRVVGASFATDRRQAVMTDPVIAKMAAGLSKALGGKQVVIADASVDESRYLVFASSDTDPGEYYLFTPGLRELRPLLATREPLMGMTLSEVRTVSYPAADGTQIPGYLTLPPGRSDARGLPAIVMPHGGPSARDEWGFDWMAQYFAQSGYAVLQPNFRGSSGYGDAWFQNNGFQSWRTAIGDVAAGGKWLVSAEGVDATKLSIVGWSYGGYAALQSDVLAPGLFQAIVAIAPVTDLALLKTQESQTSTGAINRAFIGSGPHIREGSPAQNVAAIRAPVLMFHGTFDQNVDIEQSRTMRNALKGAGKPVELIEYPELAHGLESSEARADMLRRISAFLPK